MPRNLSAATATTSRDGKRRFNVASRLGAVGNQASSARIEAFVTERDGVKEVKKTRTGRRVVEMTDAEAKTLRLSNPDVVVTEDQPVTLFKPPGYADALSLDTAEFAFPVVVVDDRSGAPLAEVSIYGIGAAANYKAVTGADGAAVLRCHEARLRRLVASPRHGHWSRIVDEVDASNAAGTTIRLRPLTTSGAYTWGHNLMAFDRVNAHWRGRGIKVGVIDSGVTDALSDLVPKGGFNTLDGAPPDSWNVDEKGHGTHCAGVIACRHDTHGIKGGAPDAEIYSLKVFPGGMVSDIIEAVEWCIGNGMDVISMSLGAREPDAVLEQVLLEAFNRGITLIAAAGNDATRVAYPAAYPTVIAVSALGMYRTFPEDSDHITKVGQEVDWSGTIFSASFTNFGPEVAVAAPGVAVVSTVPQGFASWDGTSMACPMVSALAALILEAYPGIRTRTAQQPATVRAILQASCINLGMSPVVQGSGVPRADWALSGAVPV
jgi:subtilisin family serine protease